MKKTSKQTTAAPDSAAPSDYAEMDFLEMDDDDCPEGIELLGDDTELEFNVEDFDGVELETPKSRYIKPKIYKIRCAVAYKKAAKIAQEIKLFPGEQLHYLVAGDFIYGDLIEALLVEKNVFCDEMYISSLSLSQNNIDSLNLLKTQGHVENITMMLSNYFYSHERTNLIPYLLKELDDKNFDLMIVRSHAKIVLMKINNIFITITGSANLRSSNCIEQLTIQEGEDLYNFYKDWFESNRKYSIIDKSVDLVLK